MSSAVISTSAALSRPFLFDAEREHEAGSESSVLPALAGSSETRVAQIQSALKNQLKIQPSSVTSASQLEIRPAPETASSGIPELDAMTGGLPRGCLTEICGPASSGRTSVLVAALAAATRRGEYCAVIDACDSLDPQSVADAGADLDRFLWVRCGEDSPQGRSKQNANQIKAGISSQSKFDFDRTLNKKSEHRLEQVLRATDLLLESGGFGLIILDLGDVPPQSARRIPLTTWFRFRRAVEHKPTILLAIEQQPIAGSCSSLLLQLGVAGTQLSVLNTKLARPVHEISSDTQLFTGLEIDVELLRSRLNRKPAHSITFATETAWTG